MCGITGFVDFSGHAAEPARARVRRMSDVMSHRGPDEAGVYVDDHVALGHRRLSIIDLSSGQQPMAALDGRVQIVFNGEIYNFLVLRTELEQLGHRFLTGSDTEVILRGYLQWGEHCVERLHGMFAFGIWDERSQTLFLARDRVGKKPLYFVRRGTQFAFASELKCLRAGGFCDDTVDEQALDCYFSLGYVPAPRTIYRGVRKLQAAHCMVVSAGGERQRRYWELDYSQPTARPAAQVVEEFESLLDEAVRCRLMSEVPLGAFLSGGVDSSLVVSTMTRLLGRAVTTNSIGFDDGEISELGTASAIASHLGTDHHEFVVEPKAAEVLDRIAWHFDEPLADSSALPTWYVCQMTRRSVTVALSGDGGDEAFGGYTFRYVPHVFESRVRAAVPQLLRRSVFAPLGALWPASSRLPKPLRLKTIFENLAVSDAEAFYNDLAWLRSDARAQLYRPEFSERLNGFTPFETVQPYYSRGAKDALGRSQFTDIHVYMTDDVLVKVDRMSMAHSLEVRCPLLDHRILEFAAALPSHLKMSRGVGKLPLRAVAAKRLPAAVHAMPKRGFSIPAARWLRSELRAVADAAIFDRDSIVADVLEPAVVRRLWQEHQNGSRDHNVFLWGLMMLGLWKKNSVPVQDRE